MIYVVTTCILGIFVWFMGTFLLVYVYLYNNTCDKIKYIIYTSKYFYSRMLYV